MHYYPYPFKSGAGGGHEADGRIDRLICLLVGLLCLAVLSGVVWP